jgi:hypothetical protein
MTSFLQVVELSATRCTPQRELYTVGPNQDIVNREKWMAMLNPTLHDGPAEVAMMSDLQKKVLRSIFHASNEGLRLWQVQKKVDGSKLEVQEALHELLGAGYIGILSMGGGPKYHKVSSRTYVLSALDIPDDKTR